MNKERHERMVNGAKKRMNTIKKNEVMESKVFKGLKKHKKHYFVKMEGHRVCPKCFAIKCMEIFANENEK